MTFLQPPDLVCLGRLTIDDLYLPDGTFVPNCTGGNALYASLGARLWRPATEVVVAIGKDLPQESRDQMTRANYRLDGFHPRQVNTMRNRIDYDAHGERKWTHYFSEEESDILSPTPEDIPEAYLDAKIFLVQAMTISAQQRLIPWLRKHTKAKIALDLKETMVKGNEKPLFDLISQVDIFLPSQIEAFILGQSEDWAEVARRFASLGPRVVAIKLNKNGSIVFDGASGQCRQVPAYPVQVVDATGAGDAFCGGFLATYLSKSDDLVACLKGGAISSSYAITGYGTFRIAAATPLEANERLQTWQIEEKIL